MIIFPFRANIVNEILFEIEVRSNDIFFFFLKIKIILIYLKLKQDRYYEVIYVGLYVQMLVFESIILVILVRLK